MTPIVSTRLLFRDKDGRLSTVLNVSYGDGLTKVSLSDPLYVFLIINIDGRGSESRLFREPVAKPVPYVVTALSESGKKEVKANNYLFLFS